MGCDGGTIPKRDELVRVKKKPEQKDKSAEQSFKWRHCALSQQKIQEPIVACGLGRLYSKSAVIESLLDKANKPPSVSHIKSLKDVKDLKLTKNPAFSESEINNGTVDPSPYICPIIGLEMTGNFRFLFLWTCGCVISERSFKEIKQQNCTLCQQSFSEEDVVILNGNEIDVIELQKKMEARVAKRKNGKKDKKSVSTSDTPSTSASQSTSTEFTVTKAEPSTSQNGLCKNTPAPEDPPSSSKLPSTNGGIEVNSLMHHDKSTTKNCLAPKRTAMKTLDDPELKKTKGDYCVADDPKATEVYKSLFTSHKSDREQTRAHWVTYNPFYN